MGTYAKEFVWSSQDHVVKELVLLQLVALKDQIQLMRILNKWLNTLNSLATNILFMLSCTYNYDRHFITVLHLFYIIYLYLDISPFSVCF